MASLKDIAAKTGLSMNTVSRAIRRSGYVSEKAQKLVDAAVVELNYQPNRAAQSLRSSRSYEIAVINIVNNPSSACDSMAMDKIFGIKEYLTTVSYEPNMHYMYSSPEYSAESEKLFSNILRQKPAGIIFLSEDAMAMKLYDLAEKSGIPAILISSAGNLRYDSVYVNRKQGVYDGVKYLFKKGCRNIVFTGQKISDQRFEGYSAAVAEAGTSFLVVSTAQQLSGRLEEIFQVGQDTAVKILSEYPDVDGVIAYSDYLASGIAVGFKSLGKRIPEDIAIIGFDNRELAMFCSPPLTTIAQPNRKLGRLIAEALLSKVLSKNTEKIQIKVKMELVIRQSA
jgi:LacI family transcriptional regulator, galactose operon repressor